MASLPSFAFPGRTSIVIEMRATEASSALVSAVVPGTTTVSVS